MIEKSEVGRHWKDQLSQFVWDAGLAVLKQIVLGKLGGLTTLEGSDKNFCILYSLM